MLVNYLLINRKNEIEAQNKRLFERQRKAQKLLHDVMVVWDDAVEGIQKLLGDDDPIYRAFFTEFLSVTDRVVNTVDGMLETGEPITDPFDARYR